MGGIATGAWGMGNLGEREEGDGVAELGVAYEAAAGNLGIRTGKRRGGKQREVLKVPEGSEGVRQLFPAAASAGGERAGKSKGTQRVHRAGKGEGASMNPTAPDVYQGGLRREGHEGASSDL